MGIPENIRRLRELFDLTQDELGAIAGVTGKAVWTWEAGTATPRMTQFQRMADHFKLPKSVLIDDDGMARVEPATGALRSDREVRTVFTSDVRAPVYSRLPAKAGEETEVESEWVRPDVLEDHPRAFYVPIRDASMDRVLEPGSMALVDPEKPPASGDIAAVKMPDGLLVIRRVLLGSTSMTLVSEAADHSEPDAHFGFDASVKLVGKVVWHLPPYDEIVRI